VITVRAAAKINLHLGVGAPREDGFHPLSTVYQAVGLCDDLTVSETIEPGGWELELNASDWVDAGGVPADSHNIVYRAAVALALHHDRDVSGRVIIDKAIPVAGGLAGGSADAAAALVALDRLWDVRTSDDDLLRIAGELGSDVPFALLGGTALGSRSPTRAPGGVCWCRASRASRRRRSTVTSTSCAPTPRPSRRPRTT
jgi:4-diphosphocytidyl-2-C-methyl-D-erythritol kinase